MAKPRSRQVPVAMEPGRDAASGWLRGIRFSGFSIVMMGVLILGVAVLAPTLRVYLTQRQQIADMQAAVVMQKEQVADLTTQRARWDDPSYIRAQARDRLYYVMPGEISYLIIDDRAPAVVKKDLTPISKTIQKTHTDWVQSLFASAMTAGLGTRPQVPKAPAGG